MGTFVDNHYYYCQKTDIISMTISEYNDNFKDAVVAITSKSPVDAGLLLLGLWVTLGFLSRFATAVGEVGALSG